MNLESVGKDRETIRAYEDLIVSLVDEITLKNDRVVLSGFCETLGDNLAVDRAMKRVSHKELCKSTNYPESTFDEMIYEISNAKGVIATRHHAMILALKYMRPMFVIAYNQKMTYTLQDLDVPESAYVNLSDIKKVTSKIILDSLYKAESEKEKAWETKSEEVFRALSDELNAGK